MANPEITGVFGRKGSGKSYYLKGLIREHARAIVFDPCGEHEALGVCPESRTSWLRHWDRVYGRRSWRIVLSAHRLCDGDNPTAAAELLMPYLEDVLRYARMGCLIAIDEVDAFADALKRDRRVEAIPNYGRKWGLSMAFGARRPQAVPRTLTSQCDRLVVFRMHEPRDLAYFRDLIGARADELPHLQQYTPLDHRFGAAAAADRG